MDSLLPIGVAAASIGLTYVMCIRPMRRGNCKMTPGIKDADEFVGGVDEAAEIERLRAEVAALRGGVSGARPADPG